MSRLVVVSNRLADPRNDAPPGGLAVALRAAVKANGGLWAGWCGDLVDDDRDVGVELSISDDVCYASLSLPRAAFTDYYEGFSNGVLWPLLHARPDLVSYERDALAAYRQINRVFAKFLYPLADPEDLIWVHDYHLLPLAAELRSWGLDSRIGFFLHVPVPAPEVLRSLPERDILIAALASYNLIGVQTNRDKANLIGLLTQDYDGVTTGEDTLQAFGRTVRIMAFPIGVETGQARRQVNAAPSPEVRAFLSRFAGDTSRRLILGVDRLDYSKGLPHKLSAYDLLLEQRPDLASATTFLQVAPLSRETVPAYRELRADVEALAGRINGRHGSLLHQPLQFLTRGLPHHDIMHLLAGSHVCFVASLMDGMNLVAKEYVDAQDPDDPGVLVLSSFAGAAEDMQAALIVNPYDRDEMARALGKALSMPRAERQSRHRDLMAVVERTDVVGWAKSFVATLAESDRNISEVRHAS